MQLLFCQYARQTHISAVRLLHQQRFCLRTLVNHSPLPSEPDHEGERGSRREGDRERRMEIGEGREDGGRTREDGARKREDRKGRG